MAGRCATFPVASGDGVIRWQCRVAECPLNSLRRSAGIAGNALKTVAGAPLAVFRVGMSGIRNVIGMVMNPLAALRGGLTAVGGVLRFLVSGPLALLRGALFGLSGMLGALLSPIGLVVAALAGVALVVWKYWQPISAFLGGRGGRVQSHCSAHQRRL